MVIAETLAGIALVKASVDGIKSAINTCNDIGDIASFIDGLFEGEKQIQQKRNRASQDPFSINSVAEETINAKLAQENMAEIKNLVNMRFGHGTWEGIISERARRIQEAKEMKKQEMLARRRKAHQTAEMMKIVGFVLTGIIIFICLIVAVVSN